MEFLASFTIIAPLFAVIALGYGAAAGRFIRHDGLQTLNLFVFQFALPPFLFRAIARADLPDSPPFALWLSYYGAILAVWIITFFLFTLAGRPAREKIIFAFGGGFSNTVLIGFPVIILVLGEAAALPLILIFSIHGITLFTIAIMALENIGRARGPWLRGAREGASAVMANPIIIALLLGLSVNLAGLSLPVVLDRFCQIMGQAGIPSALFLTGASLAGYRLQGALGAASLISVLKLAVHPALVYLLGYYVFALPPLFLASAVLLAGIPCGVFTFVLASRYNAAPQAASSAIILSTLAALFSLPLVISLLPDF